MNIFWIITDSICSYEREDKYSILNEFKILNKNKEGYLFNNCISLFPSTIFSVFSMITGKFPQYIFHDFVNNPPKNFKFDNYFEILKKNSFNIYSFICFEIGSSWFREILNPVINSNKFNGGKQLKSLELFNEFIYYKSNINFNKDNFIFFHFMAGDTTMNEGLQKLIRDLKQNNFWEDSMVIINSDHGFYDKKVYKKFQPLHFDDIHISSFRPILFFKPFKHRNEKSKLITKRVYTIDIIETVMDYLNLNINYKRQAKSFKKIIEKDIDLNKNRIVRSDAYILSQPIKKTSIIMDNYKLNYEFNKFKLFKIYSHIYEKEIKNEIIFKKLINFYNKTEKEKLIYLKYILDFLFNQSSLSKLKNKKIILPNQFSTDLNLFLKEKLIKNNNSIVNSNAEYIILFHNRLTGYGIKKLEKKYLKKYKKVIYINTLFETLNKNDLILSYFEFIVSEIKNKKLLLFQKIQNTLVWIIYFPLYLNKYLKKYYK